MTQLDVELAALRARRRSPGFVAWIRRHRPFDRRSIREPADRDAYWATVQRRLAESDAASLSRRASGRPAPAHIGLDRSALIGAD
jgi:hypothetical protein